MGTKLFREAPSREGKQREPFASYLMSLCIQFKLLTSTYDFGKK